MARVSLDGLRANRPQADRAKLDATTKEDIRRHTIEDGGGPGRGAGRLSGDARTRRDPAEARSDQQDFADVLGVPLATYRNWEQGRKIPDPAARSLLTIFDREPEAAMRALSPNRAVLPGKA